MTVYVDDVRIRYRGMIMCHMWADTLPELLAMADTIGVQRKWIQGHAELSLPKYRDVDWIHFDISAGKKALAIAAGAVLTDRYGALEHKSRAEGNQKVLDMIAGLRARSKEAVH